MKKGGDGKAGTNNMRKKTLSCPAHVENEGGDDYIKPKCTVKNYEWNIVNFIITELR